MRSAAERWNRAARSVLSLNRGREYRELVDRLLLGKRDAVLDVGSGDGFWSSRLARRCDRIYGLEPDDALLQYAVRFYQPRNVSYVKGFAESLPFSSGSFDKFISISCLEHFGDPWMALREAYRVLRPGGRLAISVDSLLPENSSESFRQWHRVKHFVNHYFTQESLLSDLRSIGFRVHESVLHMFRSPVAARLRETFIRHPRPWLPAFPLVYGAVRLADSISDRHHGQILVVSAIKET